MIKILLVEDDFVQQGLIKEVLESEFGAEVHALSTESDFIASLPSIAEVPPDLVVMDVMLRWCDPGEQMPRLPPECADFSVAGIRCCELLRREVKTAKIPIIVLTVLDRNGLSLPAGCTHVPKTSDFQRLKDAALKVFRRSD